MSIINTGHLGSENSALSVNKEALEKLRALNPEPYAKLYPLFNYTGRRGKQAIFA